MIKKIFQENKMFKIIIFMVVLLIPVIYSFFYLKSYWDPYGNLKDVKVAMVNLDTGTRGEELIDSMKNADNTLGFEKVTSEEAIEGLANDTYYAVITIPKDFTSNLESGAELNKHKAIITYTPNKRKNYLAYQIINSGLKTAELELQSKVAEITAGELSNKLREVPDELGKIIDGTSKIEDGSGALNSGLSELNNGVSTLNQKYNDFDKGINSASQGSKKLSEGLSKSSDGIEKLSNGALDLNNGVSQINQALNNSDATKITELTEGIEQLNEGVNGESGLKNGINSYINGIHTYEDTIESGAKQLQTGLTQYVDGQNLLSQNQDEILNGIIDYCNAQDNPDESIAELAKGAKNILNIKNQSKLKEAGEGLKEGSANLANAKNSAGAKALINGEESLNKGVESLSAGITELNNNTEQIRTLGSSLKTLQTSMNEVEKGTESLKNGIDTLNLASKEIDKGSESLSKGLNELNTNSSIIKTSLDKINNGTKSALDGSIKLKDGVSTLKSSVEKGKVETEEKLEALDGLTDFVKDPVEFKEESFGEVESYGVAFTPLFLSIGLWVGALMLYVVLYYDQRHRFGILDHEFSNKIVQNSVYLGIGAIEGIITGIILKIFLGFNVVSMGTFIFECILTGMAFTMIIQFLIRNFGDIGKFLALIVLVLQLAASGGTFPVETIDKGFQAFTTWLPMTYTIRVFKDCLIETDASLIGKNTLIILLILVILFFINLLIEFIKNKGKNEEIA